MRLNPWATKSNARQNRVNEHNRKYVDPNPLPESFTNHVKQQEALY